MTEAERYDISRILDPDSPEILQEFAAILRSVHVAEVKRINGQALETYRGIYECILRGVMDRRGCSANQAAAEASVAALPVRERLNAARKQRIEKHTDWFRGAIQNLLEWWGGTPWNPDSQSWQVRS